MSLNLNNLAPKTRGGTHYKILATTSLHITVAIYDCCWQIIRLFPNGRYVSSGEHEYDLVEKKVTKTRPYTIAELLAFPRLFVNHDQNRWYLVTGFNLELSRIYYMSDYWLALDRCINIEFSTNPADPTMTFKNCIEYEE